MRNNRRTEEGTSLGGLEPLQVLGGSESVGHTFPAIGVLILARGWLADSEIRHWVITLDSRTPCGVHGGYRRFIRGRSRQSRSEPQVARQPAERGVTQGVENAS